MYHAKRVSFLLSVLNSDDQQVKAVARSSFALHMQKRKVRQAHPDEDNFGGYTVNSEHRIQKECKVNWPVSTFVELNELCMRLGIALNFDENSGEFGVSLPADDDGVVSFRYTDHQQLYSAIKRMLVAKDLSYFADLQQQGRLQREALCHADMSCSVGHLTRNVSDHLTRFIAKGRLQLLETNAVNSKYYPETYHKHCGLCGFHTDTNSHALGGCRNLKPLYMERHDRCVKLVKQQLEKATLTEKVQIFENKCIRLVGQVSGGRSKPDLCIIDHAHTKAFIVELSNPFDAFIETCYRHKFDKYMPLSVELTDAGFDTKIIVLVIGALGTVHGRVVPGLRLLGIPSRQSKSLARYLSVSVMIGSRRAWSRRGSLLDRQ